MRALLRLLAAGLLVTVPAAAQDSPFVPPETYRALSGEISGDISYDHLRHLTLHHEEVRILDDIRFTGVGWSPVSAELWITSPDARRLASFDEVAVAIADYSQSGTWEGELVDVGAGNRDADYEGKDVAGKIVLASGSASAVMNEAAWKRGALGVVSYNASRGISYPDQVSWTRLNPRPPEGKKNTFAFSISYRAAMELKQRLAPRPASGPGAASGATQPGERITLRAEVQVEIEENPKQWIVEGWIRGTKRGEKAVLLTAHGQEEKFSANDDNSGCANLLEIGRALVKMIREGKLARPARDIRFWWVNEFNSEYEYFAAHPEERGKLLINFNQDMVGAKQSVGSRVQHLSRLPHSRPHALETVAASITSMVVRGNSSYIAAGQAGSRTPYSKPILSHLGTRERFGAEVVPYFDNTDHHVFNDVIIGVPGVTLTNYPDDFIHSSDDDLWQMDATQLQRNAFIVAATTLYFANLGPEGIPALAAQVHADTEGLLREAYSRATEMLALAAPADRAAAYLDGASLLEQAAWRASALLESVRAFGPDARWAAQLDAFKKSSAASAAALRETFAQNYRALTGQAQLPAPQLSEDEKKMAAKVPEVSASVGDFLEKRRGIANQGLHSLMAWECWNFVDGRRSYWEIYRAVRAEAQAAGAWYYGTVSSKQVNDLLDAGVKAAIIRLK